MGPSLALSAAQLNTSQTALPSTHMYTIQMQNMHVHTPMPVHPQWAIVCTTTAHAASLHTDIFLLQKGCICRAGNPPIAAVCTDASH